MKYIVIIQILRTFFHSFIYFLVLQYTLHFIFYFYFQSQTMISTFAEGDAADDDKTDDKDDDSSGDADDTVHAYPASKRDIEQFSTDSPSSFAVARKVVIHCQLCTIDDHIPS